MNLFKKEIDGESSRYFKVYFGVTYFMYNFVIFDLLDIK